MHIIASELLVETRHLNNIDGLQRLLRRVKQRLTRLLWRRLVQVFDLDGV
jgi:hypothetical protein